MPQLCERLAVKGNYVINIPPWQKTKTGQKLHQNLILMKSAPRRFGKNTRGGGDETPICKMGRNIWADGKYVHNHDYSPSSVYSSVKKWIWGPLSRVQQPLVLCSAKIGVFSRKLIENVFTLIRKLAAGAIIASTTELAVIVINCIGHNSRNSVQDGVKQIQVLGTKFCQI